LKKLVQTLVAKESPIVKTKIWKMTGAARRLVLPAVFFIFYSTFCLAAPGQSYSVDWYKISGGGGISTGGTYQVSGTIGQPDAGGTLSGGQYSVTGGFWSLISVVQMPDAPNLAIVPNGAHSIQILWPATGSYTLQQNSSLSGGSWVTSSYSISTANGTNCVTLTSPTGNLFFRLKQ
jgi:hypothetical protein